MPLTTPRRWASLWEKSQSASASESEEESKRCVEEDDECVWLERLDWSDVERFIPCAFSNSAAEEEPSAMAFTEGR